MASAAQIPVSEYLQTTYRPDREYVDGEIRQRNVGKWEHARIQAALAGWFWVHRNEWGVQVATEWRTRVSATRVRIPDLVLVNRGPQPDVLTDPPLLVIEILSPDDSYSDLQERSHDYRTMGVPTVWIIDPATRTGRICVGDVWTEHRRLEAPGTPVYIELDQLFADLDAMQ
jgi:Uma2 family endonuclease